MKNTLLSIVALVHAAVWAQADADIRSIDRARKVRHEATAAELNELNSMRLKIMSISRELNSLVSGWREIEGMCNAQASGSTVDICHGRLSTLWESAHVQLSQLEIYSRSTEYQNLIRSSSNNTVQLQELVTVTRQGLTAFADSALELKRRFGQKLAAAEFRRKLRQMDEAGLQKKQEVECRLLPSQLNQKLTSAELSRMLGIRTQDAFLVVRGDAMAREVIDAAQALKSTCANPELQKIDERANGFLGATPPGSKLIDLAKGACSRLKALNGELKDACDKEKFSPAIFYSLHLELQKLRVKK